MKSLQMPAILGLALVAAVAVTIVIGQWMGFPAP